MTNSMNSMTMTAYRALIGNECDIDDCDECIADAHARNILITD